MVLVPAGGGTFLSRQESTQRMRLGRLLSALLPQGKPPPQIPLRCPACALARTPALHADRGHSLRSLFPPQAALPSLPPPGAHFRFCGSAILPIMKCVHLEMVYSLLTTWKPADCNLNCTINWNLQAPERYVPGLEENHSIPCRSISSSEMTRRSFLFIMS